MRRPSSTAAALIIGFIGVFVSAVITVGVPDAPKVLAAAGFLMSVLLIASAGVLASWSIVFIGATLNGLSVQVGGLSLRPEHLGVLIFVIMVYQMRKFRPAISQQPSPVLIGAGGAFILWSAVVSLGSPSPAASLWIVLQYALGIAWLLPFMFYPALRRPLVMSGTYILAGVTALSLVGYAGLSMGLPGLPGVSPVSGRLQGFSFEPNIFASQAVVWLSVMYYWRRSLNRLEMVAGGVIVLGVLFAGTRSAWLALLAIGALALLNLVRRKSPWSMVVAGLLGCVGIAGPFLISTLASTGLLGPEITYRLLNLLESDAGTGAYRIDNYELAFADLKMWDSWGTGLGANTFSQYHTIDSTGSEPAYLGSLWVTLIYDSGFVGLGLFLIMYVAIWRESERRMEVLAVLLAIAICAAFTNFLWFQYAWLSIAMVCGKHRSVPEPTTASASGKSSSSISNGAGRQ